MRHRRKSRRIKPPSKSRVELEHEFGQVWTTAELAHEFVITAIIGNEVVVRKKIGDQVGTLRFQSDPALYYAFREAPAMEAETSK